MGSEHGSALMDKVKGLAQGSNSGILLVLRLEPWTSDQKARALTIWAHQQQQYVLYRFVYNALKPFTAVQIHSIQLYSLSSIWGSLVSAQHESVIIITHWPEQLVRSLKAVYSVTLKILLQKLLWIHSSIHFLSHLSYAGSYGAWISEDSGNKVLQCMAGLYWTHTINNLDMIWQETRVPGWNPQRTWRTSPLIC